MKKEQNGSPSGGLTILTVMAVVLIACGGNGVGLILGAVLWKFTGKAVLAVCVMLGVSMLGILLALCLYLVLSRTIRQNAEAAAASETVQPAEESPEK